MNFTTEQRARLEKKQKEGWVVPKSLFGDRGADIYDFQLDNYIYFIDNVSERDQLVEGLECLSPLADDALAVARSMSDEEFHRFKEDLHYERQGLDGKVQREYAPLLVPENFVLAQVVSEYFRLPLGASAIRLLERESIDDLFGGVIG